MRGSCAQSRRMCHGASFFDADEKLVATASLDKGMAIWRFYSSQGVSVRAGASSGLCPGNASKPLSNLHLPYRNARTEMNRARKA